jgi:hypothetical protein
VGGPVLNQLPDSYLSLGLAALQKQVANPFYGTIPFGTLALPTISQGQLLRPYPEYTQVTASNDGNRDSIYHSLQVKLEKRFHQGGSVLAGYTWSKNIGDIETGMSWLEAGPLANIQDNTNLRGERAVSGFDVPHRLIVSYVYDLPFGKGQHFASNTSGATDKLISGWGINGISTFQRGFPFDVEHVIESSEQLRFRNVAAELCGGLCSVEIRVISTKAYRLVQHVLLRGAAFRDAGEFVANLHGGPHCRTCQLRFLNIQEHSTHRTILAPISHRVFQHL